MTQKCHSETLVSVVRHKRFDITLEAAAHNLAALRAAVSITITLGATLAINAVSLFLMLASVGLAISLPSKPHAKSRPRKAR